MKYIRPCRWPTVYNNVKFNLNPISPGGGQIIPHHHKSICRFRRARARLTKPFDFVPLSTWQVPEKSFFEFFFESFGKLNVKNFQGSSSLWWKIEKSKKKIFLQEILLFLAKSALYMFSAFFWGIKHFCSSKFEISTFFDLENLIFDLRHLTACSRKSILHRGLFLVSIEC